MPAHDRAVFAMLRRIHREQMTERRFFFLRVPALLISQDHQPRPVGEQFGLLRYLYDVGMLRDRPEGFGIRSAVPVDRLVVAEVGPFAMRITVVLVVLWANDVEAGPRSFFRTAL